MSRIERNKFDDNNDWGDNRSRSNRTCRTEMSRSKHPPKLKSKKLPEVNDHLVVHINPEPTNNRVVIKLDKEDPRAVFAAKNISLDNGQTILVFVPDPGTLGLVLASLYPSSNFALIADNPNRSRLLERNIEANSETVYNVDVISSAEAQNNLPNVAIYSPETHIGLEAIAAQIQDFRAILPQNAELFLLTHKKSGGARHIEMVKQAFGKDCFVEEKSGMGGHMLLRIRKIADVRQERAEERIPITIKALEQTIQAETTSGLFSKEGLDRGTRLLLESTKDEILAAERVLDLGCGWGAISLVVLSVNPRVKISMVDIDPRATHLAQLNIQKNNFSDRVKIALTADPSELLEKFDLVLSNPPFHENESLLIELFKNTKSTISKGGRLFIVVEDTYRNKFENILQKVFGNSQKHSRQDNYTVFVSRK